VVGEFASQKRVRLKLRWARRPNGTGETPVLPSRLGDGGFAVVDLWGGTDLFGFGVGRNWIGEFVYETEIDFDGSGLRGIGGM
jgi:hypothetical protein